MEIEKINITLPIPPSVNQCYATNFATKRRFKSKKYKEWEEEASIVLENDRYKVEPDKWLSVGIRIYAKILNKDGTIKSFDLDNRLKPLLDFLGCRITNFDDKLVLKYHFLEKVDSGANYVEIEIKEV